jgi:inorganic pyrophosphatase
MLTEQSLRFMQPNDSLVASIPPANPKPAEAIDPSVSKWFFISSSAAI